MSNRKNIKHSSFINDWLEEVKNITKNMLVNDVNWKSGYYLKNYTLEEFFETLKSKQEFILDKMDIFDIIVKDFKYREEIIELYEKKYGKAEDLFSEDLSKLEKEIYGK